MPLWGTSDLIIQSLQALVFCIHEVEIVGLSCKSKECRGICFVDCKPLYKCKLHLLLPLIIAMMDDDCVCGPGWGLWSQPAHPPLLWMFLCQPLATRFLETWASHTVTRICVCWETCWNADLDLLGWGEILKVYQVPYYAVTASRQGPPVE